MALCTSQVQLQLYFMLHHTDRLWLQYFHWLKWRHNCLLPVSAPEALASKSFCRAHKGLTTKKLSLQNGLSSCKNCDDFSYASLWPVHRCLSHSETYPTGTDAAQAWLKATFPESRNAAAFSPEDSGVRYLLAISAHYLLLEKSCTGQQKGWVREAQKEGPG